MAMVNGGELVVRTLVRAGVEAVFGIHGGHLDSIFQGCHRHSIEVVDHRHEMAAGHAAEGYARARRSLGVALATAGPGLTNILTSIANAHLDQTPVLYLVGAPALAHVEVNMVQAGIDQIALVTPITKWAHQATLPTDLPRLVAHAIRVATSAPTGPVVLQIPMDVAFTPVDEDAAPIPLEIQVDAVPAPQPDHVAEAIALLAAAERPVLLAGAGSWRDGAERELLGFVESTGIPVFTDYQAHGLLPASHALFGGSFYELAERVGLGLQPDVALALGVRFGVTTVGAKLLPPEARLIHVDSDPKEIHRIRPAEVAMIANSREALRALREAASQRTWLDLGDWQRSIQDGVRADPTGAEEALARRDPPIHPHQVTTALLESVDSRAIFVGDGAEAHQWLAESMAREAPGLYFTHGHLGALGFGLGFSIGVQVAHPDRRVVCVMGDGAMGFTIAEFETMVRRGLPIVVVVMNNRTWGASQHFQELVSPDGVHVATELGEVHYDAVAEGFGCFARSVHRIEDLAPALREALASGRPACVDVEIDLDVVPPDAQVLMAYG